VREEAVIDRYVDDVVQRIGPLSRPVRCVYDCGNGAGALVAPALFDRLGTRARGLFCESDGTFPNHHPDPTVPENLEDLIAAVHADGAEIGIAFDGDADRIGVVDGRGGIVWGDRILILYARDVLERTGRGQPIIFDVKCSQALPTAIENAGGKPVMWKTGHSLIKDKISRTRCAR
jgi:phosphomannomutase/phosphoglucomutase